MKKIWCMLMVSSVASFYGTCFTASLTPRVTTSSMVHNPATGMCRKTYKDGTYSSVLNPNCPECRKQHQQPFQTKK